MLELLKVLTLYVEGGGVAGEGEAGGGVGGEASVEAGVLEGDTAQEQRGADLEAARGGGHGGGTVLPGVHETRCTSLTVQPGLTPRHRRHVRRLHAEVEAVVLGPRPATCNITDHSSLNSWGEVSQRLSISPATDMQQRPKLFSMGLVIVYRIVML